MIVLWIVIGLAVGGVLWFVLCSGRREIFRKTRRPNFEARLLYARSYHKSSPARGIALEGLGWNWSRRLDAGDLLVRVAAAQTFAYS